MHIPGSVAILLALVTGVCMVWSIDRGGISLVVPWRQTTGGVAKSNLWPGSVFLQFKVSGCSIHLLVQGWLHFSGWVWKQRISGKVDANHLLLHQRELCHFDPFEYDLDSNKPTTTWNGWAVGLVYGQYMDHLPADPRSRWPLGMTLQKSVNYFLMKRYSDIPWYLDLQVLLDFSVWSF